MATSVPDGGERYPYMSNGYDEAGDAADMESTTSTWASIRAAA